MTRILIDTNIYSEFLRGNNEVKNTLKSAEVIGICVISIGELLSGFKGGNTERKNKNELNIFLDSPRVKIYEINTNTSEFYSKIITELRNLGKTIPTNDVWIASVAFQHGLKLFTGDHHFKKVPGLFFVFPDPGDLSQSF